MRHLLLALGTGVALSVLAATAMAQDAMAPAATAAPASPTAPAADAAPAAPAPIADTYKDKVFHFKTEQMLRVIGHYYPELLKQDPVMSNNERGAICATRTFNSHVLTLCTAQAGVALVSLKLPMPDHAVNDNYLYKPADLFIDLSEKDGKPVMTGRTRNDDVYEDLMDMIKLKHISEDSPKHLQIPDFEVDFWKNATSITFTADANNEY